MRSALGGAVATGLPWLGALVIGVGAGLLGWSLRTYVPRKFEEPQASIVSVALLIACFPVLVGTLWAVMVIGQAHIGLVLGIYAGAGIVFLADRFTRPGNPAET